MNGFEELLEELQKIFKGKFIITHSVKHETIDKPLQIKQYGLSALKVKQLLDNKTLELPESIGISHNETMKKTQNILKKANGIFTVKDEFIHIIDEGEASCLALSLLAKERGMENVVVIDERTTRMLGEMPENLKKLFEKKFHTNIKMSKDSIGIKNVKFIRSSELLYIAWKRKLINLKDGNVLDALLYATKFKGASISHEEIEEIKRL